MTDRKTPTHLACGQIMLNADTRIVTGPGGTRHLTGQETAVLATLMRHPNTCVSYDVILTALYPGERPQSASLAVRVFMVRVRAKLAEIGLRGAIAVIWGEGYLIQGDRRHVRVLTAAQAVLVDRMLAGVAP